MLSVYKQTFTIRTMGKESKSYFENYRRMAASLYLSITIGNVATASVYFSAER